MDTSEIIKLQAKIITDMAKLIAQYNSGTANVKLMFDPPINTVADEGKIETVINSTETEMSDLSDDEFRKLVGYEQEPETNK